MVDSQNVAIFFQYFSMMRTQVRVRVKDLDKGEELFSYQSIF